MTARPFLIAMAGLPGSGKSTVAVGLGQHLGVPVPDKDVILTGLIESGLGGDARQVAAYRALFGLTRSLIQVQGRPSSSTARWRSRGPFARSSGSRTTPTRS